MTPFRDLPIERKLLVMSLLAAGSALVLACAAFFTYDLMTFRESMVHQLTASADIIGDNSASAIVFNDVAAAEKNLRALQNRQSVVAAAIYGAKGEPFASWTRHPDITVPPLSPLSAEVVHFAADSLDVFHPVILDKAPIGSVFIRSDLSDRARRFQQYLLITCFVLAISVLLAGIVSYELGRRISKPILSLVRTAREVSQRRDYSVRATAGAGGELGLLINTFNEMLSEIQKGGEALQHAHDELEQKVIERTQALRRKEEELYQSRRLESVGRLAGGVAHDFNNLLTGIIGCSETLETELPPDSPLLIEVSEIKKAGDRAAALTRQLLAFGRKQIISPQEIDPNLQLMATGKLLRRLIGEDIDLVFELDPTIGKIHADPGQIDQVIINLAVNARDAMPNGGKLLIQTRNVQLDGQSELADVGPGRYVMVSLTDTGVGMNHETRSQIFEPFFTTKELGKGTGLGLATVYGIVRQNQGGIQVYSHPGLGTTFKVFLPRQDEGGGDSLTASGSLKTQDVVPGGRETILIVEDEVLVASHVSRVLKRKGYEVLVAVSAKEALNLLEHRGAPVDLVLTDVVMPEMNGRVMIETMRKKYPTLRVLYMSGYPAEVIAKHGVLEAGIAFIEKPFFSDQISQKVRDVLDA